MKRAFFWDRDGTINVDTGYVMHPKDVVLIDGAAQAIRAVNEAGWKVIVATNQSGVARGYGTMEDVCKVNERIRELLKRQHAYIDAFYVCPHWKDGIVKKYACDCTCRKPKTGLYEQAIKEFGLCAKECVVIGDRMRDLLRVREAGIYRTILFDGDYGEIYKILKEV